jgi:hypothetical protein
MKKLKAKIYRTIFGKWFIIIGEYHERGYETVRYLANDKTFSFRSMSQRESQTLREAKHKLTQVCKSVSVDRKLSSSDRGNEPMYYDIVLKDPYKKDFLKHVGH